MLLLSCTIGGCKVTVTPGRHYLCSSTFVGLLAAPAPWAQSRLLADADGAATAAHASIFRPAEDLHGARANPVAIANHAGNGISKNARGAPGFLVFVKPLQKWLLLCCASEVRATPQLAQQFCHRSQHALDHVIRRTQPIRLPQL